MKQKQSVLTSAKPVDVFQFSEVYFAGAVVDRQEKVIRLPCADITADLQRRLARRELNRIASFCERSLVAKDSPIAIVAGVRQPFASFLLEQVHLVLAGGPREF